MVILKTETMMIERLLLTNQISQKKFDELKQEIESTKSSYNSISNKIEKLITKSF